MVKTKNEKKLAASIIAGTADSDERVRFLSLLSKSREPAHAAIAVKLLDDPDAEVRYWSLQCLAVDLRAWDREVIRRMWEALEQDPDVYVRHMASTCLGHVFQGTRNGRAFARLAKVLEAADEEAYVKSGVFLALQIIACVPADEWRISRGWEFTGSQGDLEALDRMRVLVNMVNGEPRQR